MVFYKPYSDNSKIAEWFPQTAFSEDAVYGAYTALESGAVTGKCLVKIVGTACEITDLEASSADPLLVEGLLRSALHFAANRGAYAAVCRLHSVKDVLLLLGFREENGTFSGTIPELLAGSCCKCPPNAVDSN